MKVILKLRKQLKPELKPVKVFVLIPAYNEEESIKETIVSLKNQTRLPNEIIVGDDRSTDNTVKIVKSENVHVIEHKERLGNKAFNQQAIINSELFSSLVQNLNSEEVIVCIIDADTILKKDALEKIIKVMEEDSSVMSASGYIIPQEINTIWQRARLVEYHSSLNLQKSVQDSISSNLVVAGCFAAIRYSSILKHGGFDTRTITEDFGFTCEQNLAKEKVRFVSDAVCYTKEPPTLKILLKQLDRWYGGFFQNIKIHQKNILNFSNMKFTLLIALFMSEGIYSLIIPFLLFLVWYFSNILPFTTMDALLLFLFLDVPLVVAPAMLGAAKHKQCMITLTSIPYFFMMRFVMMFAWWRALIREWFTKNTLTEWNKGH